MLKFVNKQGQTVAEMKDNGELNILTEDSKLAALKELTDKEDKEDKGE